MKTWTCIAGSTKPVPDVFEALLLAAAQATAPAHSASPPAQKAPPPSAELLEFLADWSEEEAGLIDEIAPPLESPRVPATGTPAAKSPAGATRP
ncbi:MAG: hypothetical protein RL030_2028 [Pseudomonadota bacterium]